ncbi:MAG: hypothetical protein EXS08_11255, partial [Planctomycetes bacterium]|nr:hypothetical protein [Planctomycetota bacterium]
TPRIVAYRSLLSLIRRRLTPALGHATLAHDRVSWPVRISSYPHESRKRQFFPGQVVEEYPQGTGKLLPAQTKLLIELHYTTNGAPTTDRPRLGIYFHDSKPERQIKVASTWTRKVGLQPHERLEVSAERAFDHALTVYALSPHMHRRGRSMRFTAFLPDGSSEILLDVTDYIFDWQANYTFRVPRSFPAGTRIVCDALYDNTAQNEQNPDPNARVRFGSQANDEMFVGYIVYSKESKE